jgi:hypothetical protein
MGMTTLGKSAPERPTTSTYWRRRFVALVIGLSVLALVTWALSGAIGSSAPAADRAATRSLHSTSLHSTLPSPGTQPSAGSTQHASGSKASTPRHHPDPARAAAGLRPCPASDVVLSVFSSQASYSVRQSPEFEVDVVSVASQTCTFNIGARHVWLQIAAGPVKIWSSAECAEGEASLVTQLRRGVPTVVPIGWNGQISGARCPGPGTKAAAGSYAAMASDGSASSNSLVFRMG